jgi:hypothetical protein
MQHYQTERRDLAIAPLVPLRHGSGSWVND